MAAERQHASTPFDAQCAHTLKLKAIENPPLPTAGTPATVPHGRAHLQQQAVHCNPLEAGIDRAGIGGLRQGRSDGKPGDTGAARGTGARKQHLKHSRHSGHSVN